MANDKADKSASKKERKKREPKTLEQRQDEYIGKLRALADEADRLAVLHYADRQAAMADSYRESADALRGEADNFDPPSSMQADELTTTSKPLAS